MEYNGLLYGMLVGRGEHSYQVPHQFWSSTMNDSDFYQKPREKKILKRTEVVLQSAVYLMTTSLCKFSRGNYV